MIRLACFILFICSTTSAKSTKSVLVKTTLGQVKGQLIHDEITGNSYYSYTGIPYAEAPVGKLRYKPPVPKRPWRSVFDATKQGWVCPQREEFYTKDQMDEDCLVFNVYVPANHTDKLIPVLFHVHAGDFDTLSGNPEPMYGPQILVRNNVIVTLNYRLGALGFLSLQNDEVSGNAGLKDIILAAKIIRKNIIEFGGDPKRITICGSGASGAIAEWLMLHDETKDMLFAAKLTSGSIFSSKYIQINPKQNALSLAREMGIKYRNEADLIEQLKCADVDDIVEATEAMIKKDPQRGYRIASPFTLAIEKKHKRAAITESPVAMMKKGVIVDIPILIGYLNQEGAEILPVIRKEPQLINKFNEEFGRLIPIEISYPEGCEERRELAERIRNFYFHGKNISMATTQNYIDLISDTQYFYPVDLFTRYFVKTKKSSVFYHTYGSDSELNYAKAAANFTYPGCARNDETGYEFITAATKPFHKNLSPGAKNFLHVSSTVFKYFTYYGNPPRLPETWPSAGPKLYYAVASVYGSAVVYNRPLPDRMNFWDSVYEQFCDSEYSSGSLFC